MNHDRATIDRPARPDRAEAMRRLRWRARRGLLENDLLIERFLDQQGDALEPAQLDALAHLLDCSEAELFDLLLGRREPAGALDGPAVREVLQRLRSVRLQPLGPRTSPCTPGA
jgi:antitoxin CptB